VGYLKDWYKKTYREAELARNYPHRQGPAGQGWLKHPFRATRMVAAGAYARHKQQANLPELLMILNDEYLLNRQFGQMAVEEVCGRSLATWSYTFMLSPQERTPVLARVREALLPVR
jgi:hypothetical protein